MAYLEISGESQFRTLVEGELAKQRVPREWPAALRQTWLRARDEENRSLIFQLIMIGAGLTAGAAVVDFVAVPSIAGTATLIRLALIVPVTLLALWWLRKGQISAAKRASAIMTIHFAAVAIWISAHGNSDDIARYSMATILLLVVSILFMPLTMRAKLWFAALYFAATTGAALIPPQAIPTAAIIQHVVLSVMGAIAAIILARRMWYLEAREFLHSWRDRFVREELEKSNDMLRELSESDPLTGLANRRNFERVYNDLLEEHGPAAPLSLMMIDIDHFKHHNDRFGHQSGDRCLIEVAHILAQEVERHGGHVARYGGEEFIAVLPESEKFDGANVAEYLRRRVEGMRLPAGSHGTATITASFGVAQNIDNPALAAMIARADGALYRAKQLGRNRVENDAN